MAHPNSWLIMVGDILTGYTFFGPFPTLWDAQDWNKERKLKPISFLPLNHPNKIEPTKR